MEQRSRRFVADRAMWSSLVIVSTPTLKLFSGVSQRQEPMRVQAFRAQSTVERFDERIVGRLARPRVVQPLGRDPEIQIQARCRP